MTGMPTIPPNHWLWDSDNPKYGIVRAVFTDGEHAARFDDLNGDYREVCLSIYAWDGSDWDYMDGYDDAGFPEVGETTGPGWFGGYARVVGRTRPNGNVKVTLVGKDHEVRADAEGWWLFVHPADPPADLAFKPGAFLRIQDVG